MSEKDRFWNCLDNCRNILDSLPNPVIVTDMDKIVRYINKAARAIVPSPCENLLNQPCCNFNTPYCHTENCCIERFLRNEKGAIQYGPDDLINRVDISYLTDEEGNHIGYINVSTDVRELIEVQRQLKISQERYEIALQQARTALWEYDIKERTIQRIDAIHGQFSEIFPNEGIICDVPDSLIEQGIVYRDSIEEIESMYAQLKEGLKKVSGQLHMRNMKGEERWVEISCTTIYDETGRAIKAIGISKDITEQKQLEYSYRNERELQEAVSTGFLSVFEVNVTKNCVILIDKHAKGKLHKPLSEITYDEILEATLQKVHPDTQKRVHNAMNRNTLLTEYAKGARELTIEYQKLVNNTYRWINASVHLLKKEESSDLFARMFLKDIHSQKEKEARLQEEVQIDALTNTFNRKGFIDHVNTLLNHKPDIQCALMILDIDNFKEVNDTFGHLYGDAVLSETAKKIQQYCREDTLIGRLGGDEFIVFFPQLSNAEAIQHIAERLQQALMNTYTSGSHTVRTSISMGIAFYPVHGVTFTELYDKADTAMYHCKKNGKNKWSVYDEKMKRTQQIIERLEADPVNDTQLNKPFEGNIGEYIFRILYRRDKMDDTTIRTVLELVARHYGMQYFYVMDFDREGRTLYPLLIWGEQNQNLYAELKAEEQTAVLNFLASVHTETDQIWFIENREQDCFTRLPKEIMEKLHMQALAHMSVPVSIHHDVLIGFADLCERHSFSREERNDIRTVFEVIVTFLRDQRQRIQQKKYTDTLLSLLNNLGNSVYVINPHTYELIYFNQSLREVFCGFETGKICYRVFRCKDTPCSDCPIQKLSQNASSATADIFNAKLQAVIKTTAAYVEWYDHQKYVLLSCVDVTKYNR